MGEEVVSFYNDLCTMGFSRFCMMFETRSGKYFYDAGTGKVFECEELEYFILKTLCETSNFDVLFSSVYAKADVYKGLINIFELSNSENILKLPIYKSFQSNAVQEESSKINQLILELTQQCNLRCKYCIYQDTYRAFRAFNNKDMPWEVARKSIDLTMGNSTNEVFIGFYGGEPLLKFSLMKQCIEYIKTKYSEKKVYYSITTNLTLVTEVIAKYLSELEHISILCSIDGPANIHNRYRLDSNGNDSFYKTMAGFRILKHYFGERASHVLSVNSVISPPYSNENLLQIKNFFEDYSVFPRGMKFRYSYVSQGSLKEKNHSIENFMNPFEFYSQRMEKSDPIKFWMLSNLCKDSNTDYEQSVESFNLTKIQQRYLSDVVSPYATRNGCCNPGVERLYVTVDGKYKVCEKIGESPSIGDIDHGLDLECIDTVYKKDYDVQSLDDCKECWAIHLCDMCYSTCFSKVGLDKEKKRKMCAATRSSIKNNLILYHQLMEENPSVLENMNRNLILGFDE